MKYGWIKDLTDQRDYQFSYVEQILPPVIDWRSNMPPIYDQGNLGSCTANAIAAALDYERKKQGEQFINPSRLFIYYNERSMEGTIKSDSGASIRDGIKSVKNQGDCPEVEWPYIITKFKSKPKATCYKDALKYKVIKYISVPEGLNQIKAALVLSPIVFGFTVYQSFENIGSDGIMTIPKRNEQVEGGHAVVAVGYDDDKQIIIVRNSWGDIWGDKGYFYMPYKFITSKNCSDFWIIETVI